MERSTRQPRRFPRDRRPHRIATALLLVLGAALTLLALDAAPATATTPPVQWRFETLDGDCVAPQVCASNGAVDGTVGTASVAVDWNGRPHVWFQDSGNGDLRLAAWTGTAWRFSTLDGNCRDAACAAAGAIDSAVGGHIAVTMWRDTPHVFYSDVTGGDLRHAWWGAGRWNFETLDGNCTGGGCAAAGAVNANVGAWPAALVWNDQPHVVYRDATNGDLRQSWWNGTGWRSTTLDGDCRAGGAMPCGTRTGTTTANVGTWNAAVVWNGEPHVFSYDATGGDLRHGWWGANRWNFETLDGNCTGGECATRGATSTSVGRSASTVVWNGTPHVTYYDMSTGDLRHGWWGGTRWNFQTLDGNCSGGACASRGAIAGDVGFHGTLSVWNGQPHVWYFDNSNDDLRHGWWSPVIGWRFETLDGNCPEGAPCATSGATGAFVGMDPTFLDWGGQPHVWYRDWMDGNLRHAWYA